MPGELTVRQHLAGFDGHATRRAKVALVVLVVVAFAAGFLLHPGGEKPVPRVAASALEGDVATASGALAEQALGLRATASLPSLQRAARRNARRARRATAKSKAAAPAATPAVTKAPAPQATTAPVVATPAPAAPAPAPAAPAPAAPAPKPTKPASGGEIFDSTG